MNKALLPRRAIKPSRCISLCEIFVWRGMKNYLYPIKALIFVKKKGASHLSYMKFTDVMVSIVLHMEIGGSWDIKRETESLEL